MPLLITPAQPLLTPSGLSVAQLYAIINDCGFNRLQRQGRFEVGYYFNEAASLPDSGMHQLPVNLPCRFSFSIQPDQANSLESPQAVCEAYAEYELSQLLPDATFETVA